MVGVVELCLVILMKIVIYTNITLSFVRYYITMICSFIFPMLKRHHYFTFPPLCDKLMVVSGLVVTIEFLLLDNVICFS